MWHKNYVLSVRFFKNIFSTHLLEVHHVKPKLFIERPFLLGQEEVGVGVLTEDSLTGLVPLSKGDKMVTWVLDSSGSHQHPVSSLLHYHLL